MKDRIKELNALFASMPAKDMLCFLSGNFPGKVVFSSSLGAEDQVITQMIATCNANIEIITLDTGRMFPETYDLIEKTNKRYGVSIKAMFPDAGHVESMVSEHGVNLFYRSIDLRKHCCHIRKILPLRRGLKDFTIWITGLRREQSPTRKDLSIVEWDNNLGLMKVNPLMEWSEEMVWDYIRQQQIPYNPLHDKGYPSIGCHPCTRAIEKGEDVRAGRWWWEDPSTRECGLHPKKASPGSIEPK